jgi:hypothetical protein
VVRGATSVRPIQIALAPTVSPLIAANRAIPEVCAVVPDRPSPGTWWSRSIPTRIEAARAPGVLRMSKSSD